MLMVYQNSPELIERIPYDKPDYLVPQFILMYLPQGDNFVVVASSLGSARHPAWWLNLEADPIATVQIGDTSYAVHAREALDEERAELWSAFVHEMAEYDEYQAQTSRRIPVVVLERHETLSLD